MRRDDPRILRALAGTAGTVVSGSLTIIVPTRHGVRTVRLMPGPVR